MSGTSSVLEPEWFLLLAACSEGSHSKNLDTIRSLLHSPIRWETLFDRADRHGVQPLLAQTLLSIPGLIPPEQTSMLKLSLQTNLRKALLLSRELIRIIDHLSVLGIEVVPYKGLALAEAIYGDIALRQSGDIDLMIREKDLPRVRAAVQELGFTPHTPLSDAEEKAYLKSGYELAFDGAAGPNLLEVQWATQPRFYAVDFDMEGLFKRAVAITVAGYSTKTPCPEDLFLVLALHAAKHVWARLIWLCDLARIMNRPELNWRQIGTQAQELGMVRILRVTLLLVSRLLRAPVPATAESSFPADSDAPELANEIETYITHEYPYDVESLAYFRLMLRLRERSADRLRFLSRLAFTPGPGEWAAVRLPRRLFPLYRLVRLSRLATRLVGTYAR